MKPSKHWYPPEVNMFAAPGNMENIPKGRPDRQSSSHHFSLRIELLQGGPPTSYNWVEITPITRVIRTVSHLFSAIYRGYNSIYNCIRGPPCRFSTYFYSFQGNSSTLELLFSKKKQDLYLKTPLDYRKYILQNSGFQFLWNHIGIHESGTHTIHLTIVRIFDLHLVKILMVNVRLARSCLVHPGILTWNVQITHLERKMI